MANVLNSELSITIWYSNNYLNKYLQIMRYTITHVSMIYSICILTAELHSK